MDQRKLSHQEVIGLAWERRSDKFRSKDLNDIWFWILHQYTFHNFIVFLSRKNVSSCEIKIFQLFFLYISIPDASFTPPYRATKQGDLWFWLSFPPPTPSVFSWHWVVSSHLFAWDRDMGGYGRLTSDSNMISRSWSAVQISSEFCGVSVQLSSPSEGSTSWN